MGGKEAKGWWWFQKHNWVDRANAEQTNMDSNGKGGSGGQTKVDNGKQQQPVKDQVKKTPRTPETVPPTGQVSVEKMAKLDKTLLAAAAAAAAETAEGPPPPKQPVAGGPEPKPSPAIEEKGLLPLLPPLAAKVPRPKVRSPLSTVKQKWYIYPLGAIPNIYQRLYDSFCFVLHCPTHDRVAMMKSPPSPFIWLPLVAQPSKCCWQTTAREHIAQIFANGSVAKLEHFKQNPPYTDMQIIEILRLQIPQTRQFVVRISFYVRLLATNTDKYTCCQQISRLEWLKISFIMAGVVENIWGPESVEFCKSIMKSNGTSLSQKIVEFGQTQVFHFNPRCETPRNMEETLLKSVKITENDIERLYHDFLEHCYPSFYMTFDSFRQYMYRNGIDPTSFNLKRLFNAFNYMMNGFLTFHEVLIGLVVIEQETQHDLVRIKFVFRYYDSKRQALLFEEDVKQMVKDMAMLEDGKAPLTEQQLLQRVNEAMAIMQAKMYKGRRSVSYKRFMKAIQTHRFRGTSQACRSKRSMFINIAKRIAAQSSSHRTPDKFFLKSVVRSKYYADKCRGCLLKKYRLLPFVLLLNGRADGGVYQYQSTEPFDAKEDHGGKWDTANRYNENAIKTNPRVHAQHPAHLLLKKIREFNRQKDTMVGVMCAAGEREQFFAMLQQIYNELEPFLMKQRRVKEIRSPCFVMGDIHGNLEDLLSMESVLWRQYPCTGIHYLFLGDYVDRGRYSIECAVYLMSMQVLSPESVTLLRGNHEIRELQIKYTYKRELWTKYDEVYGQKIWDLTNRFFDRLPLCAVMDQSIYCAHGGIPYDCTKLDELAERIPKVLINPMTECQPAWDILWSDPIHMQQFNNIIQMFNLNQGKFRQGYITNTKRGTSYYFNELAADNFLKENLLTHIFRAHEVPKIGFWFHFERKCTTIFSSSHYCGNNNDCAVLFVDRDKIRVVRIDTSSNMSATDA